MTTYAQVESGEALVFKFGDAATPTEGFAEACSINTDRKLDLSSDVYSSSVPPCDDPTKPNVTRRRVKSIDLKFSGAGVADMPSWVVLKNLWKAGQPFNGKLIQDVASHGWTITGSWIIDNMSVGGARGEDQTFDISISIADENWTWVDA